MNRYKLCIKGKNPDYFLRKIIDKKINVYDLGKSHNELFITVDVEGYNKIKKIKTSYEILIVDVSGVLKIKEVFNKYFLFILFFCLGIGLNIFLSKIIFDVEVVHSNGYIRDLVYNELSKLGIDRYRFKVSFSEKEEIVSKILKSNKDDLEWMEIKEVGTKYIVSVEQRKKNNEEEVCENRNIVASKNATIIDIIATNGEVVKKKLDYVLQGDVIVSGIIHNKEDIVSYKCARGKVYGEVWYKVEVQLPINYHEENVTGKSVYQVEFNFLNRKYSLFNKFSTYKKKDIVGIKSKLLPISLAFVKYLETDVIDYTYTLDNCSDEALRIASDKIENKLDEGEAILTKKVLKKELKNSKIIVEVFLKVKEDITSYQEIINNIDS